MVPLGIHPIPQLTVHIILYLRKSLPSRGLWHLPRSSSVALFSVSYLIIFGAPFPAITFRNIPVYDSRHPEEEMLFPLTPRTTISAPLHSNGRAAFGPSCQCPLARDDQEHTCSWTGWAYFPVQWQRPHPMRYCGAAQHKRVFEERAYGTWVCVRWFVERFKELGLCSGLAAVRKCVKSMTR